MAVLYELSSQLTDLPFLLYAVAGLAVVWFLKIRERLPANIPPFPAWPYPILGHIPYMTHDTTLATIRRWRKATGDIYSVLLGKHLFVALNNYELIKEALVKKGEHFADRPTHGLLAQREMASPGGLKGIIVNNGPNWKEQRAVSMQILREFGMGKNWLADKVVEEVEVYLDALAGLKGKATDVRILTNSAVSNIICTIILGRRFELDDPDFSKLHELLCEQVKLATGIGLVNSFLFLQYMPGDLFNAKRLINTTKKLNDLFSVKFLNKAKENNDLNNFIGYYYNEMDKKQKSGTPTSLNENNLIRVMTNLFAAGSETTSSTIMWAMMFALHNPDAVEKCYDEIMEFVGTGRLPNIQDKSRLNYVNAFIMESQRLGSITPLGGARTCTKTVEVGGYTIPAGTTVMPNLDEVLKDEKTWGDPLVFRPERFLDENNKVFVPEQFIPFSIGRRYCMGDSMAKMELFLFISSIFQRFYVLPEDPQKVPPPDRIFGITSAPKSFKVRFMIRDENNNF